MRPREDEHRAAHGQVLDQRALHVERALEVGHRAGRRRGPGPTGTPSRDRCRAAPRGWPRPPRRRRPDAPEPAGGGGPGGRGARRRRSAARPHRSTSPTPGAGPPRGAPAPRRGSGTGPQTPISLPWRRSETTPGAGRETARSAAALFGAASLVTALGLLLPHVPQVDVAGLDRRADRRRARRGGAAGGPRARPPAAYPAIATAGTVLVSLALHFNGERHGGPAGGDEMYYLWIVLWAAYYLSRRALALQVALVLGPTARCWSRSTPAERDEPLDLAERAGDRLGDRRARARERVDRLIGELRGAASTDPLTQPAEPPRPRGRLRPHAGRPSPYRRAVRADRGRPRPLQGAQRRARPPGRRRRAARDGRPAAPRGARGRHGGPHRRRRVRPAASRHQPRPPSASPDASGPPSTPTPAMPGGPPASASASAVSGDDGVGLDELMRHADARMYGAKRDRPPRRGRVGRHLPAGTYAPDGCRFAPRRGRRAPWSYGAPRRP